ncbi:hypothetical protein BpHYR1_047120, partial [Brachionus plicatilis]
ENIYNYLSELEFLAEAAHPEQPYTALKTIVVDRFIRGIHDIKIKQELCKPPTCNTLKDALQKAYELEEAFRRCNPPDEIKRYPNIAKDAHMEPTNSKKQVQFEASPNQNDWCTICTHHKHLNKDCHKQQHSLEDTNQLPTHDSKLVVTDHMKWYNITDTILISQNKFVLMSHFVLSRQKS